MKKGMSAVLVFLLILVVVFGGYGIYYFYTQGTDVFLYVCNKSRNDLEKAYSIFSIEDNGLLVQGPVNAETYKRLKDYLSPNAEKPECKLGGEMFITKEGKVFCNLHGFGDRIPLNKKDIIPFPEDKILVTNKIPFVSDESKKLNKLLNKDISYTSEEERFYIEGMDFLRDKKYFEAIGSFKKSIKNNPDELKYYESLINTYIMINDYENAEKYIEFYISKNKDNSKINKTLKYLKARKYFNLRLKKLLDDKVTISFLSYSTEKNQASVHTCLLNGDNMQTVATGLGFGDYWIGENLGEYYFINDDKIILYNDNTKTKKQIFDNRGYRMFNFIYSPISKKFIFSAMKMTRGFEIYGVNQDGNELLKITQNTVDDFPCDFSPNGRKFVYTTGNEINLDINIVNVDGTSHESVVKSVVREDSPDWAPTRNTIAYSSYKTEKNSNGMSQRDIFIWETDSKKTTNISNSRDLSEYYPNWSNKNDKILFAGADLKGYFELYVMDADGKNVKKLSDFGEKRNSGWDYYEKMTWFDDDNLILFSAGFEKARNIYITEISSGNTMRLTDTYNDDIKPFILRKEKKGNSLF
ncbi:MAG: hypothetical protein M0R46_03120 [Candidatus Muirbacterium halophilum]|nr:hypothetical protein [Candidatus Muirbacterium halophilum]MCK9474882.1 hypothetical protein [Candidatus Muirbacterium halophilum]